MNEGMPERESISTEEIIGQVLAWAEAAQRQTRILGIPPYKPALAILNGEPMDIVIGSARGPRTAEGLAMELAHAQKAFNDYRVTMWLAKISGFNERLAMERPN